MPVDVILAATSGDAVALSRVWDDARATTAAQRKVRFEKEKPENGGGAWGGDRSVDGRGGPARGQHNGCHRRLAILREFDGEGAFIYSLRSIGRPLLVSAVSLLLLMRGCTSPPDAASVDVRGRAFSLVFIARGVVRHHALRGACLLAANFRAASASFCVRELGTGWRATGSVNVPSILFYFRDLLYARSGFWTMCQQLSTFILAAFLILLDPVY
jgi:hypothetical protein